MKKTANKRNKVQMPAGIRNKMMAAVSMLMVSAVMLVSSTYAWFTLSTAPEVTGITTNVGANGNLEMMLLTGSLAADGVTKIGSYYSSDDDLGVVSAVGDSVAATQDATESNITWGNLVDLSDGSYGLNNVVLSPARLNITAAETDGQNDTIGLTILNAPSYGSDGRVVDVKTATYTGMANGNTFIYNDAHAGVRVIGTTTDVSQRLAAYRAAKGAVTTNANTAKNKATASLFANGQSLANILVGYVNNPNATYTNADLKVLKNVLTSLQEASESIATAMKSAVIAYSLSDAQAEDVTLSDTQVSELQTAVNSITTISNVNSFKVHDNVLIPAGLDTAIATYVATDAKIESAMSTLNGLNPNLDSSADGEGAYSYSDISPLLNDIIKRENVEIAGKKNLSKDDLQFVIDEYTSKGSITITMLEDSGVYADIAEMVGNYTVSGLKVHVEYGSLKVDANVTMNTKVSGENMPNVSKIAIGGAPKESGQAANSILSNTYGYALDFGFRTNAATSDLLLQTAAVNRVYSDQNTEADANLNTQGSGSYMEFNSSDVNNFTQADVLALMSAIRIAFVSPTETGADVLAMAALDIESTFDETSGITTYTGGDSVEAVGTTGYKAGIYLHEYTVSAVGEGTADEYTVLTLGDKLADKSVITALEQNVASKISVIVYLDGDIVDNTMVANAETSMTGKMNLQFSSSATLAPMENTGMREGGSTGEAITYTEKATSGQTLTFDSYTGTVNEGYTIYEGSNGNTYFSTDGKNYTKMTLSNYTAAITVTTNTN